jgi:hypothetical protein
MALHNFAELYTEWFAVCISTTSKFRTIAIFKSFVEENNDSDKTCRWIHILLCQMSFVWVEPFMSTVHEYCPWVLSMSTVHEYCSWVLSMSTVHEYVHEYCSWVLSMSTVHEYCPWVLFMSTVHEYCSWNRIWISTSRRSPLRMFWFSQKRPH